MSRLPRLNSGDLRDQISFVRAAGTATGGAQAALPWSVVARPWAEVLGINGRSEVIADALQGVSYFQIRIRWRADLLTSDQVRYRGQDLRLTSISDPNGDREQLLILADTSSPLVTDVTP